jgi:heme ABC exporter ATP-binding subunit CcmA
MSAQTFSSPDIAVTPAPASQAVVTAASLTKRYGLRPVLRNVSFSLASGKTLALLGPNGAGKTTLLRLLATLAKPSAGEATICGFDVVADANVVRRLIGYVGHQPPVYDDLTGRENLLFFARMYGLPDGPARAQLLLERVGLRAKANDRVRTYSRGQAQRLALARGLLHHPALLLLDEPDTGLDDDAIELLHELLQERQMAGLTTIFTTHQLERGIQQSDETLVLLGGRVVFAGASSALTLADLRRLYGGQAGGTL